MLCPRCGSPTHVTHSTTDGTFVRRRRMCGEKIRGKLRNSCGLRFTTVELPAGSRAEVKITLTSRGLKADIVR